ncbi:hypothetical protein [Actinomyces oris]|uniref:hypothetical protein n=1 Tax=Actinomyces oris TaxID=544580 RepID=UPI00242DA6C7|nr:hypothetical protein [Actinomyces oris]
MSHLPPQNPNRDPRIEDAGHPRNAPRPVPYGRYNPPVGQTSAAGFGSIDPVLMEVQGKRSATRKVSVAGSIIGLITMSIQVIASSSVFVAYILPPLEFTFLALLMAIAAPFVVGLGWIVTFILGLIACIRANSRTPQVQPDGWIEAKMPTSALLAASIVAGLPTLVIFLTWFWQIHRGTDTYVLYAVLVVSYLVQVLIAVGFIVLLRRSKALDPTVRAS